MSTETPAGPATEPLAGPAPASSAVPEQPGTPGTPSVFSLSSAPSSRRTVLRGVALAGAVGVTGIGLAACGGNHGGSEDAAGPSKPVDLGAAADVPVGGAKLYREDKLVVSQPQHGTFKAYSAVCTHAGCVVDSVEGTTISCPCHGSQFDALTGAVVQGPAVAPLPAVPVRQTGSTLTAGPTG